MSSLRKIPWRQIYLVFMFSVLVLWWIGLKWEREKRATQPEKAPLTETVKTQN